MMCKSRSAPRRSTGKSNWVWWIGKPARYVSVERALRHVAGYCGGTTRRSGPTARARRAMGQGQRDTFAPMGPWLVTRDEVPDAQALDLWLDVDGRRFQNGMGTMIFNAALVSYISRFMSLQSGDVIFTGTPPGVGFASQKPQAYLRPNQTMRLGITGPGVQQQRVIPAVNSGNRVAENAAWSVGIANRLLFRRLPRSNAVATTSTPHPGMLTSASAIVGVPCPR